MEKYTFEKLKKEFWFQGADNQKYVIGSKLYPIASKKNIHAWAEFNTEEVKRNDKLAYFLDNLKGHEFKTGKCFRNALMVQKGANMLGLNCKFYSGWLFARQSVPIFHAWNVLDDTILIDTSLDVVNIKSVERLNAMNEEIKDLNQDEVREIYLKIIEEETKKKTGKVSENIVWGKIPIGHIYFGCEDTHAQSQERFRKALESVPVHPSYHHRRDNLTGESELQQRLKEKGLW